MSWVKLLLVVIIVLAMFGKVSNATNISHSNDNNINSVDTNKILSQNKTWQNKYARYFAEPTPTKLPPNTATPLPRVQRARADNMPPVFRDWSSYRPEDIVCDYNWPCERMLELIVCESSNNPLADSNYPYVGWFQIDQNLHAWRLSEGESYYDPVVNTRIAYEIYLESGMRPWPNC